MMSMNRKRCREVDELQQVTVDRPRLVSTVHDDHHYFFSPQNPNPSPNPNERLKMVCASFYLPKDKPEKPLGEDAHFVCSEAQTIGVADGVGGWAKQGIDSGEYARELMCNASLATLLVSPAETVDPMKVLCSAYDKTVESKLKGSSTACVVSHSKGILRSANVGDSGFLIFRGNRLVYRSETQQRGSNNCPYQLGNSEGADTPESAIEATIPVMHGDVVILGSDGFLDNMFPREVESLLEGNLVKRNDEGIIDPAGLACLVAENALYNSFDRFTETPYSAAARKAGRSFRGGKIDDITVLVGLIVMDCKTR